MIYQKELKNHRFVFDSGSRVFSIYEINSEGMVGHNIHLHYVQANSFVLFALRMLRKHFLPGILWKTKQKKK